MPNPSSPVLLQFASLRTISVENGGVFDWHSHPFEEFTLVTDDHCLIGYPQQHDFNRVFHRHTGMAPSKWRTNPLARSAASGASSS